MTQNDIPQPFLCIIDTWSPKHPYFVGEPASLFFLISLISLAWLLDSSLRSCAFSKDFCKKINIVGSSDNLLLSVAGNIFNQICAIIILTACLFATATSTSFLATARLTLANFLSLVLDLVFIVTNLVEVQDCSSWRALNAACSDNKVLFSIFLTRMQLMMFLFPNFWPGYRLLIWPHQYLSIFGFLTTWTCCRPLIEHYWYLAIYGWPALKYYPAYYVLPWQERDIIKHNQSIIQINKGKGIKNRNSQYSKFSSYLAVLWLVHRFFNPSWQCRLNAGQTWLWCGCYFHWVSCLFFLKYWIWGIG